MTSFTKKDSDYIKTLFGRKTTNLKHVSAPAMCKKMKSRFVLYSKQCFRVNRQGHGIIDLQNVVKKIERKYEIGREFTRNGVESL